MHRAFACCSSAPRAKLKEVLTAVLKAYGSHSALLMRFWPIVFAVAFYCSTNDLSDFQVPSLRKHLVCSLALTRSLLETPVLGIV